MRGRRTMDTPARVLKTRPDSLSTKQGAITRDAAAQKFVVNYFRLRTVPTWVLHQYRVDIAPEEERTGTRKYLLRSHQERLGGYIFDGTVLYTQSRLTTQQNPELTLTSSNREGTVFTITIRHVGQVDYGDYAYVQVYNLILRYCMTALGLQLVGRDYYDPAAKISVPQHGGMELWPGYKTSIRQHESSILNCVDVTWKVMRIDTVLDELRKLHQRWTTTEELEAAFRDEVAGCVVLTKYNNKTYRVDSVDWGKNPASTFDWRGEQISFAEYMKRKYNIGIRDMKQPLLVSKASTRDRRAGMAEEICLIPEVCYCTGLTDAMRANYRLMQELAVHTRMDPGKRIQKLMDFNQKLLTNQQAVAKLKMFDMSLENNLVTVDGRVEVAEQIICGGNGTTKKTHDWTRDLRGKPLLTPKILDYWVVLVPTQLHADTMSFITAGLQVAASGMNFNMHDPQIVKMQSGNAGEYSKVLDKVLDQSQPKLIMCVVLGNRAEVYSAIKKKCCVDRAVPTQVIQAKNVTKPQAARLSIASKVAIQMCCKIGGAPWTVSIPLSDLMVVGFDVFHDNKVKGRSQGAMVASLDQAMSRYYSTVTAHRTGEELSTNLAASVVCALRKYREVNDGRLPGRIIIYRDGVGEGQIPYVITTELNNVKVALNKVYNGQDVKMAYVIVTKRINTRIFTNERRNAPPGSVVDDVITDPEKYDFFLVSQSVGQGTVSPTSYNRMPVVNVHKTV
ncbi:piwi-like protein Siwi [Frankliniella occidentalis]|uniref:Piwi-like protein Siwi n=1 Tax=Frankliniella occidentalis TaxID=133901 RepID=A0A9C6WS74_FRAOC|nr:piwi-like protein Siwi [Frankliniella occidentalis]